MAEPEPAEEPEELPAWSLPAGAIERIPVSEALTGAITREWAWSGATGRGVTVCVLDSGVDASHPLVGPIDGAVVVSVTEDGEAVVEEDKEGDLCGHGTACAGIIRSLAPEAGIFSVRVLGAGFTGSGPVLLAGLRWAVEQGFPVVNMSLSTTKSEFVSTLHELADTAYFGRTLLVSSAHNMPVQSYPWRFSSVISVGSHEETDPYIFYANPKPPVEFFARGLELDVAWLDGETLRATGNSFATPHIAGICALILSKHPELRPFEVKTVLHLTASNVGDVE
jgi:subtilisin family serine protease